MGDKYRLYIWHDVFCDYTCGVAFAIARSAAEARKAIAESAAGDYPKDMRDYITRLALKELRDRPKTRKVDASFGHRVCGGG